jgi:hypothetical protein
LLALTETDGFQVVCNRLRYSVSTVMGCYIFVFVSRDQFESCDEFDGPLFKIQSAISFLSASVHHRPNIEFIHLFQFIRLLNVTGSVSW